MSKPLSDEHKNALLKAFQNADVEKKGYLSREDLKIAMVELFGYKPSKYEVDDILRKINSEKSMVIELKSFVEIMGVKMSSLDNDEEIRQIFLAFDTRCRGFLGLEDVKKVFAQIAPYMDDRGVERTFQEIDRDGDGRVSYRDFEFMMKYSLPGE